MFLENVDSVTSFKVNIHVIEGPVLLLNFFLWHRIRSAGSYAMFMADVKHKYCFYLSFCYF